MDDYIKLPDNLIPKLNLHIYPFMARHGHRRYQTIDVVCYISLIYIYDVEYYLGYLLLLLINNINI